MDLPYLFFLIANLLLIVICMVMGGVRFYALRNYPHEEQKYYFPDGKLICIFLFSPLLELPYVFRIHSEAALFYAIVFDFVLFIPQAIVLWEKKFYHTQLTPSLIVKQFLLPVLILIPLFWGAVSDYAWTDNQYLLFIGLSVFSFLIGLYRLYQTVVVRYQAINVDLDRDFVLGTYMVLSLRMVFIVACFALLSSWSKMVCDLVFAVFTIYTIMKNLAIMRPPIVHNKPVVVADSEPDEELSELGSMIRRVIEEKELFRQSDLKLISLCEYIPTNRTYLSAEINKMDPKGFYSFILNYRIEYACKLMVANPDIKIEEVAIQSGFSSQKVFSRLFRQQMGISPSVYRGMQTANIESADISH